MSGTVSSEVPISKKMKSGLNKKDFMFVKETGKELVKASGSINGQAFQLDTLEGCTVYLMDFFAQVNKYL